MTTATRSAETALQFLRTAYEPDDCVALLLKSHLTSDTAQRVGPLSMLLEPRLHAWLRAMNVKRYSVFVAVNTIQPGVRARTKRAIAASVAGPLARRPTTHTELIHPAPGTCQAVAPAPLSPFQNRSSRMSILIAGTNPKFQSKLTTLDALRSLPEPQPLGLRHRPVPHAVLVDALLREVEHRGYATMRTQLALGANGAALFGILDLIPTQTGLLVPHPERILSLGFRNATDQRLALHGVAGTHVTVCDNLALSGQMFAFRRKNTTGLDLGDVIATGFDRFLQHARTLERHIKRLSGTPIPDGRAKQLIFDVFNAHIVPLRLFEDVSRFYFHPTEHQPDCQPRSEWGLHNAFTRAMHDLTPLRQFGATQSLGRAFGLGASEPLVLDAHVGAHG